MTSSDDNLVPDNRAEREAADVLARLLEQNGGSSLEPDVLRGLDTAAANELLQSLGALRRIDDALTEGTTLPTLGDYRLLGEIGRGAMGVVYEAEQLSLGRRVALKVLRTAGHPHGTRAQRFRNEARAAASLHHPNIVPVFAFGTENETSFYVMQLIEGISLRRMLQGARDDRAGEVGAHVAIARRVLGSVPRKPNGKADSDHTKDGSSGSSSISGDGFKAIARIAHDTAIALAHAHEAGVLHRDIKPANLLVDHNGHIWVTDFGLAHFTQETSQLTASGEVLGTLAYASPEQVAGKHVAERSDVYALGVTLYELATKELPHAAEDRAELIRQVLYDAPRSPRAVVPEMPRDLATIISKAMAKEPRHRYESAQSLADDLLAFRTGRPITARPVTPLGKLLRWARRKPALAAVLTGAVVLAISATIAVLTAMRIAQERDRALAAEARLQIVESRFAADSHRRSLAPSRRAKSLQELSEAIAAMKHAELSADERLTMVSELRAEVLDSLSLREVTVEELPGDGTLCANHLASGVEARVADGRLQIRNAADGTVLAERALAGQPPKCTFDESGDWLLAQRQRPLVAFAWRWRSGPGVERIPKDFELLSVAHQNGTTALGLRDGRIAVGDLHQGKWRMLESSVDGQRYPPHEIALDARQRWLATVVPGRTSFALFDLTGQQQPRRVEPDGIPWRVAFHPDGDRMAVGTQKTTIELLDMTGQPIAPPLRGHRRPVTKLRWGSAGSLLISNGWDDTLHVWDVSAGMPILRRRHATLRMAGLTEPKNAHLLARVYAESGRSIDIRRSPSRTRQIVPFSGDRAWLHPTGRFVVLGTQSRLRCVSTETLRTLGGVPIRSTRYLRSVSVAWLRGDRLAVSDLTGCKIYAFTHQNRDGDQQALAFEELTTLPVRRWKFNQVAASASGERLAWLDELEVTLYDAESLQELQRVRHGCAGAEVLHLSRDGRYASVDMHNDVVVPVIDFVKGAVVTRHPAEVGGRSGFAPDNNLVALSNRRQLVVQDLDAGCALATLDTSIDSCKTTVAFLPDGRSMLCNVPRDRIQVFDRRTWQPVFSFGAKPRADVYALESTQDGSLIMGATTNEVHLWNFVAMQEELHKLGLLAPSRPQPEAGLRSR